MNTSHPELYVCLSPALLDTYQVDNAIVVVIDILRASSTIVAALHNGAEYVYPVDSVDECIRIGTTLGGITAGERDGQVAPGLQYGNSPFEYPEAFIKNKILVITTTNGTKLLYRAKKMGAQQILIGAFLNIDALATYLIEQQKNVILACAGWKNKVNIEDMLFAGAVVDKIKTHFKIACDSALIADNMYRMAQHNIQDLLVQTSHYQRLAGYGLHKDIAFCFTHNVYPILVVYDGEKLIGKHTL